MNQLERATGFSRTEFEGNGQTMLPKINKRMWFF